MNTKLIHILCNYLLARAKREQYSMGRTKLVKLLYLIDLEYYRYNRKLLTGAKWIFYHYGPYSRELNAIIDETPGIIFKDKEYIGAEKDFIDYEVEWETSEFDGVEPEIRAITEKTRERWGSQDLATLLDYVYFDTEPMQGVQRNEPLRFDNVNTQPKKIPPLPDVEANVSQQKKQEIKALFVERKKKLEKLIEAKPTYDEVYFKALKQMNSEDFTKLPVLKVSFNTEAHQFFKNKTKD